MAKNSESKLWAFLVYLLSIIGFVLVYLLKKDDKFAMYHAKQSLVLFLFAVIIAVVGSIVPVLGWFIILPLGNVLVLVLAVMGIINALQGKMAPLWLIGKYADKLSF